MMLLRRCRRKSKSGGTVAVLSGTVAGLIMLLMLQNNGKIMNRSLFVKMNRSLLVKERFCGGGDGVHIWCGKWLYLHAILTS
eukprot:COSAG01_NODE_1166_length_11442_cov_6.607511_2_plen_82_part_00